MKKILITAVIILGLATLLFLSSCGTSQRACPAYPPSTYDMI